MKTKLVFLPFVLLLAFFMLFSPAQAANLKGNDLEIILDCSGSMAQTIEGKSKLTIAKESLTSVVNSIPDGSFVGFRAYGHRNAVVEKESSCKDSELIFPIGSVNKSDLLKKIKSLQAKGWTPIDYSLRQAKNDFSATSEFGKRIILVSDGEETCGGDPCAAVKELINSGFKVQVDTVGFDVDSNTEKQLRCIAEASGGEYKSAKNAKELTESLRVFSTRAFEGYKAAGNVIPGLGFGDAPLVSPGIYGADLLVDESKFYKFNVKKGQKVSISVSIKKERPLNMPGYAAPYSCGLLSPTLTAYGFDMAEIVKKQGSYDPKPGGYYLEKYPTELAIAATDTSPKAYNISYESSNGGENYVSVTTSWKETCIDPSAPSMVRNDLEKAEKDKPGMKSFYDVKITIEGAGIDEPANTTIAATSTSAAAKNTNDSNLSNSLPTPPVPQKSSSAKWIIITAISALIVIIGGGLLFYFLKKKKSNLTPEISLGNNYPNPDVAIPPSPASPFATPPTNIPPAPPSENFPPPQPKDTSDNQEQPISKQ